MISSNAILECKITKIYMLAFIFIKKKFVHSLAPGELSLVQVEPVLRKGAKLMKNCENINFCLSLKFC